MKRTITWILVLAMVLAFSGCGMDAAEPAAPAEEKTETVQEATDTDSGEADAEADEEQETAEEGSGVGVNMVVNGDFSNGIENWGTYLNHGGSCDFREENEQAIVDIDKAGATDYGVQIFYDGFKLDQGGVYEFSFDIDTTLERDVEVRLQLNGGDYHAYFGQILTVKPGMEHYSFEFTMEEETDVAPRLCFNFGTPASVTALDPHVITLDNVAVILLDDSHVIKSEVVDLSKNVNLDQVGFLPDARKTAVIRSEGIDGTFTVKDTSGKEVYSGKLTGPVDAVNADEKVYRADFSDFKTPGEYTVCVSNGDESYPFKIGEDVYDDLLKDTFLMLYRQRCGMETEEKIAGEFAHPVCHDSEALIYGTDTYKDVSGGWHDAGDYGRYVVAGATTVEDLFLAYEDFPTLWDRDDIGIPESGNGIPDILDEAAYELKWMLKMQDEKTGGVYHKVTCREFPEFVMPQEETEELVIAAVSNTATGDFAAVMAKASDLYADIDPAFAKTALDAAKKAYAYLEEHKSAPSYKNPEEITTGEYPDGQYKDEMYWAAVELYRLTGEEKYKQYAEELLDLYILHGFGWDKMGSYGNIAYLRMDEAKQDPAFREKILTDIKKKADEYLQNAETDGYMVALGDNYCWGSNLSVCAYARQMLLAREAPGADQDAYEQAAYDQLSYILGQNATGYCFVTGYGGLSAQNPHHRPSVAVGKPMPGMVIGGPDGFGEDSYVKSVLADEPPAKCYADNAQSYSTNEVTIYWNSPFVYLLSAMMDTY
ncbi:MAG: glycoside hydrolase family 9 protein [Lachnospiraceae bacterium]|nr:glycoside hydrolase family 9 protein [Lachnospiraceae bacterium]